MAARTPTIVAYRAKNGQYAWRLRSRNGRILVTPGETYKTKAGVRRAIAVALHALLTASLDTQLHER